MFDPADYTKHLASPDWRDVTLAKTFRDARTGGWKGFTEKVASGHIRLLVPRRTTRSAEPNIPIAAAVPASLVRAVERNPDAPHIAVELKSSYHLRQAFRPEAEAVRDKASPAGGSRNTAVLVQYGSRRAHDRVRVVNGQVDRHEIDRYEGSAETIALVPVPWLARVLGVDREELEGVDYAPKQEQAPGEGLKKAG